ncbi:hypothetical protein OG897_26655 [Streptomyces sp. NBC_00237]|uniref:hypothetical protein n=1 Tax=Streptomyces sp. NBC_00237 TaxID=2975687 RepID=UPI0022575810|nr:hypothetical protein [Streptomyces sp. NBC_00237]MCX5205025.1 hypothetical protein [Streptomyces sp. NBC_00237]
MTTVLRMGFLVFGIASGLLSGGVAAADGREADGREADLGHHGQAVYEGGRLDVRLRTWNHGPVSLDSAAVRVSFSVPVTGTLPPACIRQAPSALVCETGALPAGSVGARPLALALRVGGAPDEVVVEVRTVRMGAADVSSGTRDLNPDNDRRRVLALDTGDPYYF